MNQPDRYTCEQVFQRLDDYLDRELSAEEMQLIREHLEICAWCAGTYEFQEGVLNALRRRLKRVPVSPELLAKVSSALKKAQSESTD